MKNCKNCGRYEECPVITELETEKKRTKAKLKELLENTADKCSAYVPRICLNCVYYVDCTRVSAIRKEHNPLELFLEKCKKEAYSCIDYTFGRWVE